MKLATRIKILKGIDQLLGPFGVLLSRSFLRHASDSLVNPSRYLFIRPGGIGDAVLLVPIIKELIIKYPHAYVDVLTEKRNSLIFSFCPEVKRIMQYDRPAELYSAIRGKYDVVIDTEQWHLLPAVVARLTRAPMLVGYATNKRKKLFTNQIPYSHDDYELNSFLNLIAPLTGPLSVNLEKPFLEIPAESSNKIRILLNDLESKGIVAVFPGGSIGERRWGSNRFHLTARALIERGYSVAVVGGSDDSRAGDEIAAGLQSIINFCGKLSLVETAAVLKESALLITGDSGIMHIGFGLGIKTLSLFGPGIEKKWAPRGPGHVVINKKLPCSPCTKFGYTPKCKINAECMKQISVDEVLEKALEMLEG